MPAKPKPKNPKKDDKEQSARFIETARELAIDETDNAASERMSSILNVLKTRTRQRSS